MTEPTDVGSDPVVQAALQLLPVPSHRDDFWADLDRRLDAVDGPKSAAAPRPEPATRAASTPSASASVFALAPVADPTPVPSPRPQVEPVRDLAAVPLAMRRRSNAVLAAVAVAALLVVGVAGAALVRDQSDDGGGTELADGDQGATSKQLDKLVATTVAPAGAPEALSKKEVTASRAAATTFATDHAEGGTPAEWDKVLVTPVSSSKTETLAVVTLVGAAGTETYAVRLTDDGAEVIPYDTAGTIEMVTPAPLDDEGTEATVSGSDDLVVVLPEGATTPVLRLDDGTPVICGEAEGTHLAPMDGMDRVRCAWTPTTLTPGEHTLTVAFTGGDGSSISADSVLFQAA